MSQVAQRTISRDHAKTRNLAQWWSRWLVLLYHLHLGRLLGRRFVLITQPVCRGEMSRQTGVLILHDNRQSRTVRILASQDAEWYRDLQSLPAVEIMIGPEQYRAEPHFLELSEIMVLLRWSRRHHPIATRVQSMFLGWPWNPSNTELLNLANSLGGVAFRPI